MIAKLNAGLREELTAINQYCDFVAAQHHQIELRGYERYLAPQIAGETHG